MLFCTRKQVAVANAYTTGQKVMGQANQKLGKLLPGLPEDLHFCGFFGVSADVGHGLGYDGEPQYSPPYFQVPSFFMVFMGACIHAHISYK
jgi:hypothetical protein